jgi:sulfopyruvate decarboxylase subunit alpha
LEFDRRSRGNRIAIRINESKKNEINHGLAGYSQEAGFLVLLVASHFANGDSTLPISLDNSRIIHEALKKSGIRLISALPETWLVHLIRMADEDPEVTLVRLAKEEEGVGISAGAHFAGVKSAMLMQNHGFLASINGIVSFAQLYRIPLLMLISYRGHFGERDPWQTQGGGVTEPLLRALGIRYEFLDDPASVEKSIVEAQTLAYSSLHPVALLLTRKLMWED